MKKYTSILVLTIAFGTFQASAQITTKPPPIRVPGGSGIEVIGKWKLGSTRTTGFTKTPSDYTVKFYDAPWSIQVDRPMSFSGGFTLDKSSNVIIRIENGKKGQRFLFQITASAATTSGTLILSSHKGEELSRIKMNGSNKEALISFVYESTGENGKEYVKLTSEDYWNFENVQISSTKN